MSARFGRAVLATIAVAAVAALGPTAIASGGAARTEPTLTLERDCESFPGFNSVDVIVTGFPPFTPFQATLELPDGGAVGPLDVAADASGHFHSDSVGSIGVGDVGVWTATIVWAEGTLISSLFVDCTQPEEPTSKEQCKRGGWRDFDFKNQGQCVAFVQRDPK